MLAVCRFILIHAQEWSPRCLLIHSMYVFHSPLVTISIILSSIGSLSQKILDWQWCVELWHGAVWDLVSWEKAVFKTLKWSSNETTPNWSLPTTSPWMSKSHLQTDGWLLVQQFVCNKHKNSTINYVYNRTTWLYNYSLTFCNATINVHPCMHAGIQSIISDLHLKRSVPTSSSQ